MKIGITLFTFNIAMIELLILLNRIEQVYKFLLKFNFKLEVLIILSYITLFPLASVISHSLY